MTTPTPTEARRASAARLAEPLGLDGDALHAAALAVWSNLNPQTVTYERALSVAAVALAAAEHYQAAYELAALEAHLNNAGANWSAAQLRRHLAVDGDHPRRRALTGYTLGGLLDSHTLDHAGELAALRQRADRTGIFGVEL